MYLDVYFVISRKNAGLIIIYERGKNGKYYRQAQYIIECNYNFRCYGNNLCIEYAYEYGKKNLKKSMLGSKEILKNQNHKTCLK